MENLIKVDEPMKADGDMVIDQFNELVFIYDRIYTINEMLRYTETTDRAYATLSIVSAAIGAEVECVKELLNDFCRKFSGLEYRS